MPGDDRYEGRMDGNREEGKQEMKEKRKDSRDGSDDQKDGKDGSYDRDGKREDDQKDSRRKSKKGDTDEEPSKSRPRHTSKSESESTSSQRGSSQEKTLADRLLSISNTTGEREARGKWLTEQMDEFMKKNGLDRDGEPTEEEIKKQLKLPNKEKVMKNEFKEPLKNWMPVENSGVPSWRKELLKEDEDRRPPTPPRVDISLQLYKKGFMEETPMPSKIADIVLDKERILREDLSENDEVVLLNNLCIIRTTKAGIKKSKRDRQDEDNAEEQQFRGRDHGGRDRGGRGRFRGGRGGGGTRGRDRFSGNRNRGKGFERRSISSSPGRDESRQTSRRDQCEADRGREDRREYGGFREPDRRGQSPVGREVSGHRESRNRPERREADGRSNERRDGYGGSRDSGRQSYGSKDERGRPGERRDSYGGREERRDSKVECHGSRDTLLHGQGTPADGGAGAGRSPGIALGTYKEYKAKKAAKAAAGGR